MVRAGLASAATLVVPSKTLSNHEGSSGSTFAALVHGSLKTATYGSAAE